MYCRRRLCLCKHWLKRTGPLWNEWPASRYTPLFIALPLDFVLSHVRCFAGDRRLQDAYRTRRWNAPAYVARARGVAMEDRTTDPQVHAQRTGGRPLLASQYRAAIHQQRGQFCWHATRLTEYMHTSIVHTFSHSFSAYN